MKILCLVDWSVSNRWIWEYLPDSTDQVDFLFIPTQADKYSGYGKLLAYYPAFARLGLRALPRQKKYDLIVAWEGKNGVPLAFLRSLFSIKTPPMVIINFVLKGKVVLDNLWFTRFALRSVNLITCVSKKEMDYYPQKLRLPRPEFAQLLTFHPDYHDRVWPEYDDYVLAAGRSHRDYATFFRAVEGLPIQANVNARLFNIRNLTIPVNVKFNQFLPRNEFTGMVRKARFAVIPLFPAQHASGESFLLECMAAGKPVIATETYSTEEFIKPGVNGFLVPPGDPQALREKILLLYQDPTLAQTMGQAARKFYEENCSFPAIAPKIEQILQQVVAENKAQVINIP
jgi:glycosyltransferase involved in cell wall biosynthesis